MERLHIVYEDEEYVTSYMILGIFFIFIWIKNNFFVHIKEDMIFIKICGKKRL